MLLLTIVFLAVIIYGIHVAMENKKNFDDVIAIYDKSFNSLKEESDKLNYAYRKIISDCTLANSIINEGANKNVVVNYYDNYSSISRNRFRKLNRFLRNM